MSSEQRIHTRQEFIEETIYFSEERSGQQLERVHYSGTVVNISKGGVGMKVSHPHPINSEIWLEGLEGFRSAQPATVKWIKAQSEESFEIGVQFS